MGFYIAVTMLPRMPHLEGRGEWLAARAMGCNFPSGVRLALYVKREKVQWIESATIIFLVEFQREWCQ
jgi:hypothetical protein